VSRARLGLAAFAIAIVAVVLAAASPLRETSGDTVPGRIGGLVLRCGGTFDAARVDWVKAALDRKRTFYFLRYDHADEMTSVFGPAPAVVGALAVLDVGDGDSISDASLRTRERLAAAMLIALSAVLLFVAAMRPPGAEKRAGNADVGSRGAPEVDTTLPSRSAAPTTGRSSSRATLSHATLAAAVAVLSFAGVATLGQGLWQATTALPFLVGALATLAWRTERPRLALVTPALLLLAVMLRPTIAPLVLGLGITWARDTRSRRTWIIAAAIALVAASPLVAWNAIHLYSPLPIGQWKANAREASSVFSIGNAGTGVAGLLVSPARGLLWFAPLALVGVVTGLRSRAWRFVAAGVVLQLLAMALFFKWHGGQAFGPRLLAEATWIGIWLALGRVRIVAIACAAITILVGQLGLWSWRPEQWESRRVPEAHPSAFWDVVDSPLASTIVSTPKMPLAHDSPPTNGLTCDHGHLRSY
jgi:hypothetical protein